MKEKTRRFLVVIFCFACIVSISIIYSKLFYLFKINIPCILHEITGFHCPGCGITRMIFCLLKFDFYNAFRYNPFIFCLLPFIIYFLIDFLYKYINDNNDYVYNKINNKIWIMILIAALFFGIIRNISYFNIPNPDNVDKEVNIKE